MENLILIGSIILIHILAWCTPGPIFVLIVRNSLLYSRRTGVWTAVGVALGNALIIGLCIAGVALFVSKSDGALSAIRFLGAAYLAYLGLRTLLHRVHPTNIQAGSSSHHDLLPRKAVWSGFLVNILSPKAWLFFVSIIGTVLATDPPDWVVGTLWVIMPLTSLGMATLFSFLFTHQRVRILYASYEQVANYALGIALVLFAVIIAVT